MPIKTLTREKYRAGTDWALTAAVLLLVGFGLLMLYSASRYAAAANLGDGAFYLKKQMLGLALGLMAMFGLSRVNYRVMEKWAMPVFLVSLALLGLVFIPGVGVENYGARRWIDLPGFTIQPSEIAKFGLIIFAAAYMSKNSGRVTTFRGMLPVLGAGGATALLIILEPNMSITMCVILLMLAMLFIGGASIKHFILLALPLAALVAALIVMEPYRLSRLAAFLDPWASPLDEGFQLIQSFYAIGSGGLFGVGLFNSRQAKMFLPFAESDFILSIIIEELGLFGAVLLLALYLFIIVRLVKISLSAPDRFGCYYAAGVAAIIAIQVLINIAVVTGSIPPTGLPLPFISAGGSSLVVFLGAVGTAQNVCKAGIK